jgi:peptidoglycan/LPS O-acetylase OafA/YrhL
VLKSIARRILVAQQQQSEQTKEAAARAIGFHLIATLVDNAKAASCGSGMSNSATGLSVSMPRITVDQPVAPGHATGHATGHAATTDAYRTFTQTKFFGSLNGIRAICCLLVIKSHSGWNCGIRILDSPGLGVELFFVISGFLITTLLIREREKTGTIALRDFYARRSLRIFPIYYASIVIALFVSVGLLAVHRPHTLHYYQWAFVVLLTYTQDFIFVPLGSFHPCWSLAMEEQFYLMWPTIEKLASTAVRWAALIVIVLLSELVNFGVFDHAINHFYHDPKASLAPLFQMTFTPIALGVCIAHCYQHRRWFEAAYRVVGHRWSPLLWLAILAVVFSLAPLDMSGVPRLAVHLIVALMLASLVIREDHAAAPFLKLPLLARLGAISYGLYLYHQWVLDYTHKPVERLIAHLGMAGATPVLRFVIVGTLCVLVAELSFRYFEQPILRKRAQFQK